MISFLIPDTAGGDEVGKSPTLIHTALMNTSMRAILDSKKGYSSIILFVLCMLHPSLLLNGYAQTAQTASAEAFWLWKFLGRLHPLIVHFPVSLLLFAGILELFTLRNFNSKLRPGINVLVLVGAVAAVFAAVFGWLLSMQEDYGGDTLSIHQWTGIATAALSVVALALLQLINKNRQTYAVKAYRGVVFFTAIGVSVAGHFGGALTHGNDYLTSVLPWNVGTEVEPAGKINFASFKNNAGKLSEQQEMDLNVQVRAVLAHNCYSCHSAEKIKGELRLDKKRMAFKGGKSGPVIIPGDPVKSELVRRITLPRNHKEAMPSKGKRLSEHEIELISFWIEKGAPWPDVADQKSIFRVAKLEPRMPALPAAPNDLRHPIDLWVNQYFKQQKAKAPWAKVVDDRTYLRRIYLDIIGLLPTPEDGRNGTANGPA